MKRLLQHKPSKCIQMVTINGTALKLYGCQVARSFQSRRSIHESYIPQGRGGRSSFSGVVATVFGPNGFLGRSVVNHLASSGASLMLPHRGETERMLRNHKVMGDLGQLMFREFSIKNDDDHVRDLIKYSNCVVNLIGTRRPWNHYTMEEVNVEWPRRLANLVAEKDDGTRLIQVSNLNCHLKEGRLLSNILAQEYEAEQIMREIYPNTTIVRSANCHGHADHYVRLFLSKGFQRLAKFGALPLLYDAGKSTVVQPVFFSDVGKAVSRIATHPNAHGKTFELVSNDRFTLHDMCEYIFEITDSDHCLVDLIGPLDRVGATRRQDVVHKALEYYFWKMDKPRPLYPRFLDLLLRDGNKWDMWMSRDYYNQLHLSDTTTGAPGFSDLGITPSPFEERVYEWLYSNTVNVFRPREKDTIPRLPLKQDSQKLRQLASHIV